MKFPSIFRLPQHQKFEIKPRYYDPQKERIKERIQKKTQNSENDIEEWKSIRFRRETKFQKNSSVLQLLLMVVMVCVLFAWLEFGRVVFYYLLWGSLLGYILYRLRLFRKSKKQ